MTSGGRIDFDAIASLLLRDAVRWLEQWFPDGTREGGEYKIGGVDGSKGRSLSVRLIDGLWMDFNSGEGGKDLISLYAARCGLDQGPAAKELSAQLGMTPAAPASAGAGGHRRLPPAPPPEPAPAPVEDGWRTVMPVPPDARVAPVAHLVRGKPVARWEYRDAEGRLLGYVARFVTSDGGKEIIPLTLCRHSGTKATDWRWRQWDEPRPLYGLDRLAARPDAPVLVVEGEKCADVPPELLPGYVLVSWPGGGKAVRRADWSALAGRAVTLWPDCDAKVDRAGALKPEAKQPGVQAMEAAAELLLPIAASVVIVAIPPPAERPDGWDVADAVEDLRAEGFEDAAIADGLAAFVADVRLPACAPEPVPPVLAPMAQAVAAAIAEPTVEPAPADAGSTPTEAPQTAGEMGKRTPKRPMPPADPDWELKLLRKRGDLVPCVANVSLILRNDRAWRGVLAFDEFSGRVVKRRAPPYQGGAEGEWGPIDDTWLGEWVTLTYGSSVSSAVAAEAVESAARAALFHPVREYLGSLAWDGEKRIDRWLVDYCGADDKPYTALVGRYFLIALVARVMEPGCKHDNCLILEGPQGQGKSTVAAILGGEWSSDTDLDLSHKDAMAALQGKWLHEFAEIGSLARADEKKQKSFLSRQIDEFRPVYGRRAIKLHRQCSFVGSTNDEVYLKDPTGARRFWPVAVAVIQAAMLRQFRDQLFAEAAACYAADGDERRWWPTADEQRDLFAPEQARRTQQESLVDALHDWVYKQGDMVDDVFSIADAVLDGLKLDASKLTRDMETRVGIALRKLGCMRIERRNGMVRYMYKAPQRNAPTSSVVAETERLMNGGAHAAVTH